jgi:beta-galactosidase
MEQMDQASGCILYRTNLAIGSSGVLKISGVHDIGQIFLDGKRIGTIDRRYKKSVALTIPPIAGPGVLDILVEAMGRVNYGKDIHDRKGITGSVEFSGGHGAHLTAGWDIYSLPCDQSMISNLRFSSGKAENSGDGPLFRRGSFSLRKTADTHLDMRGWGRGSVWVNGHHLGRYWHIGPQQTMYVPGVWLKEGTNTIDVLDLDPTRRDTMQGLASPILNRVEHDEAAPPSPIRARGKIELDSADQLCSGSFADGPAAHDDSFAPVMCRYAALQSLSSQRSDPFASAAEIFFLGDDGKPIDRKGWKIFYVDGEELEGEDGRAENVLDDDTETIWHSPWYKAKPPHPHVIAIDFGESVRIRGIRYLPRPTDSPGRIKEFRVYGRKSEFAIKP